MQDKRGRSRQENTAAHIFQRAKSGFVVFYNVKDSLVFLTLLSTVAERLEAKVISLCLMYNHIHILLETADAGLVRTFVRDLISSYARIYNKRYGLSGELFDRHGVSFKRGGKAIRTALAYVNNNPVEDRICRRAENWRWNFLSYNVPGAHPYSEKIVLAAASRRLRRAVGMVRHLRSSGIPPTYEALDKILAPLTQTEKQQVTDLIINEYLPVDQARASRFYGGYKEMLAAFAVNTGNEYDIVEPFDPHSGLAYKKMVNYLAAAHPSTTIGDITRLPMNIQSDFLAEFVRKCEVKLCHARKFLHLPDDPLGR